MKWSRCAFTLIEALVVLSVVLFLSALIVPALRTTAGADENMACMNNFKQIGLAVNMYSQMNGEFYPAHSQYFTGTTDDFKPMPSLALLYPDFLSPKVFGCPATKDKPFISRRQNRGAWWTCFGTDVLGKPATNPARYSGLELSTELKCSYFYDERLPFRNVNANVPIACDADGQTWLLPDGGKPPYPANWTRAPRTPNHPNGQNVLYYDGHVRWTETVYAASDPNDNIFCPNGTREGGPWDPEIDAYLWDGVNARAMEMIQK